MGHQPKGMPQVVGGATDSRSTQNLTVGLEPKRATASAVTLSICWLRGPALTDIASPTVEIAIIADENQQERTALPEAREPEDRKKQVVLGSIVYLCRSFS